MSRGGRLLSVTMARGVNTEEAHYMERLWAALLARRLPKQLESERASESEGVRERGREGEGERGRGREGEGERVRARG